MNMEDKNFEQSQELNIQNSEDKINLLVKSSNIYINSYQKINSIENKFGITSNELENVVSNYTDLNNKTTLLESIELLGGTQGIIQKLNSSESEGIKQPFEQRKENFGINKIFEEPPASFMKFLKESLSELMIVILLSAAIIQIIIGLTISDQKKTGWLDGASVLFAVFVEYFLTHIARILFLNRCIYFEIRKLIHLLFLWFPIFLVILVLVIHFHFLNLKYFFF